MSIRSCLLKLLWRNRAPTLQRAEQVYAQGQYADAAAAFRAMAERGETLAQLHLRQLYERGEWVLPCPSLDGHLHDVFANQTL